MIRPHILAVIGGDLRWVDSLASVVIVANFVFLLLKRSQGWELSIYELASVQLEICRGATAR